MRTHNVGRVSPARNPAHRLPLPITLWTDLDNKQPPFVEVTEGGIFMGYNGSINWNLLAAIHFNCFTDECCSTISVLIDVVLETLICNIHLTETC